jgi:hypothetical protein
LKFRQSVLLLPSLAVHQDKFLLAKDLPGNRAVRKKFSSALPKHRNPEKNEKKINKLKDWKVTLTLILLLWPEL